MKKKIKRRKRIKDALSSPLTFTKKIAGIPLW